MAISEYQRRRMREVIGRKRGIPAESVSDELVNAAIRSAVMTATDHGSHGHHVDTSAHTAHVHVPTHH